MPYLGNLLTDQNFRSSERVVGKGTDETDLTGWFWQENARNERNPSWHQQPCKWSRSPAGYCDSTEGVARRTAPGSHQNLQSHRWVKSAAFVKTLKLVPQKCQSPVEEPATGQLVTNQPGQSKQHAPTTVDDCPEPHIVSLGQQQPGQHGYSLQVHDDRHPEALQRPEGSRHQQSQLRTQNKRRYLSKDQK